MEKRVSVGYLGPRVAMRWELKDEIGFRDYSA